MPFIDLDDEYYKPVEDFDKRFQAGVPSLKEAESLVVSGDWTFGDGVRGAGRRRARGRTRPRRGRRGPRRGQASE